MRSLPALLMTFASGAMAAGTASVSLPVSVTVHPVLCSSEQKVAHPKTCAPTVEATTVEPARVAKPNPPGSLDPTGIAIDPLRSVIVRSVDS